MKKIINENEIAKLIVGSAFQIEVD